MLRFWVHEPAWEGAGPENSTFYLAVWDKGYLQTLNEWRQWFSSRRYNWLTFDFAHIEIDIHKIMYPHVTFEFILLGLGVRVMHSTSSEEELEADDAESETMWDTMEARSTQSEQLEELWALLPEDMRLQDVPTELRKRIELGLSEPEDGKRKILATPQALGKLEEILK